MEHDESVEKELSDDGEIVLRLEQLFAMPINSGAKVQQFDDSWMLQISPELEFLSEKATSLLREYHERLLERLSVQENYDALLQHTRGRHFIDNLALWTVASHSEFSLAVIVCLMKNKNFYKSCYTALSLKSRWLILGLVIDNDELLTLHGIDYFQQLLITRDAELTALQELPVDDTGMLLELLSRLSYTEGFKEVIQRPFGFITSCVGLLRWLHFLEKDRGPSQGADRDYPFFCCKRHLVQIIGNLCCNDSDLQDEVRELDGIHLILDCTPIDPRNPFITQQCVVALRFLLEGNPRNQAVVAAVARHGRPLEGDLIAQLGLRVEREGAAVRLRPTS